MSLSTKWKAFREMMKMDNGLGLVVSRLLYPGRPLQVCRFKGLEFITDLSKGDANGARSLLATDEYRKFLGQMNLPGRLNVLDLGANNGGFPLLLASEGHKFEKLVCVEFVPETYARLVKNLGLNFSDGFEAVNAAVNGDGKPVAFSGLQSGTGANIYEGGLNGRKTIDGITLDDLILTKFGDEEIDICKIDIEGAEFEVFSGSNSRLIVRCRYLLMEIHHSPDRPREPIIGRLRDLGFAETGPELHADDFHHVHLFMRRED